VDHQHEQHEEGQTSANAKLERAKIEPEQALVEKKAVGETDKAHNLAVRRAQVCRVIECDREGCLRSEGE